MKRAVIFLLIIICSILQTISVQAAILNVPTIEYPTIQSAIDVAVDGDTILVSPGTYYLNEDIVIPVGVSLSGEHWDTCSIDLGGYFQIQPNSFTTIEGFSLVAQPKGRDIIFALNVTSLNITNNVIQGNPDADDGIAGIFLDHSSGNIENNIIDGGHTGIRTRVADDSIIINNIVTNTVYGLIDTDNSIFSMDYNNFWGNTNNPDLTDTNNISTNPYFVDMNNSDYRLCSNLSPCIDTGHPDSIYRDVDNTRNDIGADGGPRGVPLDDNETCNAEDYDDETETEAMTGGFFHTCFIANAAYGTPMAKQVRILCTFRDKYLLTNFLGNRFVNLYYKYSPPIAEYIAQREFLRKLIRIGLWVPVIFATFMVKLSLLEKLGIIIIFIIGLRKLVR